MLEKGNHSVHTRERHIKEEREACWYEHIASELSAPRKYKWLQHTKTWFSNKVLS